MRKVELIEYTDKWVTAFAAEKRLLEKTLGGVAKKILHVGSTSVPGLVAKPIIDILIGVASLEELDAKNAAMINLDYDPCGEFGISGRRYYKKGGDNRTHHVHAFLLDNIGFKRHLVFRDYLRTHSEVAAEYAALKKRVVAECENSIQAYCDGKNAFVQSAEAAALNWQSSQLEAIQSGVLTISEVYEPDIKAEICEVVLRGLPEWFGIEQAVINYINEVKQMQTLAAYAGDEACGFISLNTPNAYTAEIHVMGLLEHCHGHGVGTRLVEMAEKSLARQGFRFLQVKTLSPSRPCPQYELTRKFYQKLGFCPVEEFKTLWGEANPCLQLIKTI